MSTVFSPDRDSVYQTVNGISDIRAIKEYLFYHINQALRGIYTHLGMHLRKRFQKPNFGLTLNTMPEEICRMRLTFVESEMQDLECEIYTEKHWLFLFQAYDIPENEDVD